MFGVENKILLCNAYNKKALLEFRKKEEKKTNNKKTIILFPACEYNAKA